MTKQEELAKVSKNLMLREPFYGMFLLSLNKIWSKTKVKTAGVGLRGINYELHINDDFWESLVDKHKEGLIKHELLHIGFFHITDFGHLSNKDIANVAMDLEINQYIDSAYLPSGGMVLDLFPELNLEPKRGTQYYYDKLMEGAKSGQSENLNKMIAAMIAEQATCEVTVDNGNSTMEVTITLPDHKGWGDVEALPEATQKLIKTQTEHILKQIAEQTVKMCGHIPGEFEEILEKITTKEPPKFDWRSYLRRFSGGSTKIYTKKTRRKDSKRYSGNPGLKIKQYRHILVAIDTSGSVSTNELKAFMHEMFHIQKNNTDITMMHIDTYIRYKGPFDHRKELKIYGRGGTSFEPAIEYYNENTHKYTCLVYFTDGEASAPPPARGRMLWVLSAKEKNESLIGPQILIN